MDQFSKTSPFTTIYSGKLTPRAQKLTRQDLAALVESPFSAAAALNLTFQDLQSLQSLASTQLAGTGNLPACCCCCCTGGRCCCCCCATLHG